nr:PH domain-containing protein YHR131C-like [Setaria viridis]
MARTRLTTHKSTIGYQARFAPAQPGTAVQPVEEVEEDLEEVYYYNEMEDGSIMEVYSDGNLVIPTASLAAPASDAPAPAASTSDTSAPADLAPAPATDGGDPDDFGDDSDDEDEDEDDDDDDYNTNNDHSSNNDHDSSHDNNSADEDGNQNGGQQNVTPACDYQISKDKPGYIPTLLLEVL